MKRIIIIIAIIAAIVLCGCASVDSASNSKHGFSSVEKMDWGSGTIHIIDNATGVVYIVYRFGNGCAITPAYNEDKTLLTARQLEVDGWVERRENEQT